MASPITSSRPAVSAEGSAQSYRLPFAIMTILFFMWGFMTVWNDILIPRFKEAFSLSYFQAMLVQLAFFGAYGIGSAIYFALSVVSGDPINKIGYKNGVVIGLVISAVGCGMFYPAAIMTSYWFFLAALFTVGLGFAMLQIAANPYVTILGPERTASSRLNLSQAFNSFGTTIGPIVAGWLMYEVFAKAGDHGADSAKIPYLGCAAVFLVLAVIFAVIKLPTFTNTEEIPRGIGALAYPHTALGMLAIFMYVGGEVSVGSAIVNWLGSESMGSMPEKEAAPFLAYYWGGLMIGRFMGAFALSELRPSIKNALIILTPIVAFFAIKLGFPVKENAESNALHYGVPLLLLLVAFYLGSSSPARLLALFGSIIIALLATGIWAPGEVGMWAILGVGLFCSVMWSNIFSLAIEGLGNLKSQASSLLVMAILGGAILPPLQGYLADHVGIQASFVVPMVAFAYIVFYGVYGYRAGRKDLAA